MKRVEQSEVIHLSLREDGVFTVSARQEVPKAKIRARAKRHGRVVIDLSAVHQTSKKQLSALLAKISTTLQSPGCGSAIVQITGIGEPLAAALERVLAGPLPAGMTLHDREFAVAGRSRTIFSPSVSLHVRGWERDPHSRRVFERLVARDGSACVWCSRELSIDEPTMTIDHVHPRSAGGPNSIDNYVIACAKCNAARGNKDVRQWLVLCLKRRKPVLAVAERAIARAEARMSEHLLKAA